MRPAGNRSRRHRDTAFAPLLNQRVKDGKIVSWMWAKHEVGGKYRRLLVFGGADVKALMNNWNSVWENLQEASPDLARRFGEVCHSHTDYIWDFTTD